MLVWSTENREWNNGSKQKVYLMEVFTFNKDKKINNFNQWRRYDPKNEFGLPYGGKFYGKKDNEYTGRNLVFSNRGEVEAIESLIENYNKMDGAACQALFAENAIFDAYDGVRHTMSAGFFDSYFENYESVTWKAYGIVPLKIQNTHPVCNERAENAFMVERKDLFNHFGGDYGIIGIHFVGEHSKMLASVGGSPEPRAEVNRDTREVT